MIVSIILSLTLSSRCLCVTFFAFITVKIFITFFPLRLSEPVFNGIDPLCVSRPFWHCWFGYVARKNVHEMTYYVSAGTMLNLLTRSLTLVLNLFECVLITCFHSVFWFILDASFSFFAMIMTPTAIFMLCCLFNRLQKVLSDVKEYAIVHYAIMCLRAWATPRSFGDSGDVFKMHLVFCCFCRSDVWGQVLPMLGSVIPMIGSDWSQAGIAQLYQMICRNGYKFLYLSARAIGQSQLTRDYLRSVKQSNVTLPDGPLLLSPSSLMSAFHKYDVFVSTLFTFILLLIFVYIHCHSHVVFVLTLKCIYIKSNGSNQYQR